MYLDLFWEFLKIGAVSFGGAYAAIPVMRDAVTANGWLTEESLSYFIAVSESTPGPIMVNLATYIGSSQGGIGGAALATLGVILPAFLIIVVVARVMKAFLANKAVAAVLGGIKPAVIGLILATGIVMLFEAFGVLGGEGLFNLPDVRTLIIALLLVCGMAAYKKFAHKALSPILLIAASAVFGVAFYAF